MNESALSELPGGLVWARLGLGIRKPQINADERRFVNFNIQHLYEVFPGNYLIKSPQSTQRAQSSAMPATRNEKAPPPRRGTRIARIFTDTFNPCVSASSAQSVSYRDPSGASAFVSVHPRLIFYREMRERGELAG
jgi:hypothetical protein